jgi:hypothetical protein
MSVFFVMSVFLSNCISFTFGNENILLSFLGEGRVCVCTRWVGLCVTAEKMEIYSYKHVGKNSHPQNDP